MRFSWLTPLVERLAPPLVLIVLVFYTYAELWQAPYLGFNFSGSSSEIGPIYVAPTLLHLGDRIRQVNDIAWSTYVADSRQPLFPPVVVGDLLTLQVLRDGSPLTITWSIQPPTISERLDRAINVWWLGYMFWLTGTLTIFLVRPKDTRWRLLIAFYYLTATWLVVGNTSRWHLWESGILLRMLIWLSLPVYLHLHWVFPHPLRQLPRWFWSSFYLLTAGVVLLQAIPLIPRAAYLYSFMATIVGSIVLLSCHWLLRPESRPAIRILLWATGFAFIPILGVNLAHAYQALPWFGPFGLLGLVPIPAAYFYAVYRYQLGRLELRANRVIALFLFSLLITAITLAIVSAATSLIHFAGDVVLFSLTTAIIAILVTASGFLPFQRFIERRFLGIRTPVNRLLETYASRIGTRLALPDLLDLLQHEVLPSLLVRQSALVQHSDQQKWEILYTAGLLPEQLPTLEDTERLYGDPQHNLEHELQTTYEWIRLVIPLRLEGKINGYWLLGRRDPDDFYSQSELALFQALADQTAIALANIEQAIQLRSLYQANVDRHEIERHHLALALHDDVLNQLAALSLTINGSEPMPEFDQAYDAVTTRIRQLITGLRPAMLAYGLGAALEELADDLTDRMEGSTKISCEITDSCERLTIQVEQYIFRIVQQAVENAVRHAQAERISIYGSITPFCVELTVEDNGIGFPTDYLSDQNVLLAAQHFGIVGMYERANIIGAKLQIESFAHRGTKVAILCAVAKIS